MSFFHHIPRHLAICMAILAVVSPCLGDDLRNVKQGEPVPEFRLPSLNGSTVDSESMKGSVVVLVYLSAQQRRSELAAVESFEIMKQLDPESAQLIHVTADVIQRAYFEKFRTERNISSPLLFDADRTLYARLGMIVFPTTIIIDREGNLSQVISLHGEDYKLAVDAYVRHALGLLTDEQLKDRLSEPVSGEGSPKSVASAHRALARSMRERGRLQMAESELRKAIELDPMNTEIMLDLADLELQLGRLDETEQLVGRVLGQQPDHRRAKQLKGVTMFYRGDMKSAESMLLEALNLNPSPELAHYYLGRIYEERGDLKNATEHYRAALGRFIDEPSNLGAGDGSGS